MRCNQKAPGPPIEEMVIMFCAGGPGFAVVSVLESPLTKMMGPSVEVIRLECIINQDKINL